MRQSVRHQFWNQPDTMITQFRDVTYASQAHAMVIEEENDRIITFNVLSLSFFSLSFFLFLFFLFMSFRTKVPEIQIVAIVRNLQI